ncbi:MAG: NAD(P)-dependent oxidoreductase [Actinobacteria bacterium]|nr:NAD(P)-dependent oxidoreductase [Actinomycetota bacterium]
MLGLNEKLRDFAEKGKYIKTAVVGLGQMGLSLISHLNSIKGFKVTAAADKNTEKLNEISVVLELDKGENFYFFECNDISKILKTDIEDVYRGIYLDKITDAERLDREIEKGRIVFTNDFRILPFLKNVDIIVDATGYPEVGAAVSLSALCGNKHVVTLNVEADVTVGPMLKEIANDRNLVYTLSAGDEPAALKELYDFADALGFNIICAGKGKNNPLDIYANPTTLAEYSESKGSSPRMMTSFVDGTKSMIEMACLSNATGLIPDCRGMHGARANIKDLISVFSLVKDGGILEKEGVIDFVIGDLAPGVFLVYSTKNTMVRKVLRYLVLGEGPNYLLYRPYHLTSVETPLSIARAYFERQPWMVSRGGLISEIITVAKKDLIAGDVIDGIGGYTVYGLIDLYETAKKQNLLPIGLSKGCILKVDKKRGETISNKDVKFGANTLLLQLRRLQDEKFNF